MVYFKHSGRKRPKREQWNVISYLLEVEIGMLFHLCHGVSCVETLVLERMVEVGFEKAWSDNLPEVDAEMVASFFCNNPDFVGAEIGGAKATRASRQSYGDEAMGFIQLQRMGDNCTVKARITPEHKVRSPDYHVKVIINETEKSIETAECISCIAQRGGCKHIVAFIFWLHRRSMEPAVTSKINYWKASKLSRSVRDKTFVKASELGDKAPPPLPAVAADIKERFIEKGIAMKTNAMICHINIRDEMLSTTSLYQLALDYEEMDDEMSTEGFITFCKTKMTHEMCKKVELQTRRQDKSPLWSEMRFGRITASKAYEAAHCKTPTGTLVETIMGAAMPLKVAAVTRGKTLEKQVLEVVAARMDVAIEECGIFLSPEVPLFGASPDGVTDTFCFEVKCPIKEQTVQKYIHNGTITATPYAQMQLQMHLSGRTKCMFCVASPQFERNNEVTIMECGYDENYCTKLINDCTQFWGKAIFNKLCKQ